MRLSAPRLAISAIAIGAAAATTGVAFAAAGPGHKAPVAKVAAPAAVPDDQAVGHNVSDVSAAKADAYWTPERMRAAKPYPVPAAARTGGGTSAVQEPAPANAPNVPPSPVKGASGDVSAQAVVNARQWPKLNSGQARTVGRLFFKKGNRDFICSGTVVTSPRRNMVWTAGHCVNEGGMGPRRGWHNSFLFVPRYRDGRAPLGRFPLRYVATTPGWVSSSNNFAFDHGAGLTRRNIQRVTGAQGIRFHYGTRRITVQALGFPAVFMPSNKPTQGHRMYFCTGRTSPVNLGSGRPLGLSLPCTMGGGASGGPWLTGLNRAGWGRIVGVNSAHEIRGIHMISPYQGAQAVRMYNFIKTK